MNHDVSATIPLLGALEQAVQRDVLVIYATRRSGWGMSLPQFVSLVGGPLQRARTELLAAVDECDLKPADQVSMVLRYLDLVPDAPGAPTLLDNIGAFRDQQRQLRMQQELEGLADRPAPASLPAAPAVATAPAQPQLAAAAIAAVAGAGYVSPMQQQTQPTAPAATVPQVHAPAMPTWTAPAPSVVAPQAPAPAPAPAPQQSTNAAVARHRGARCAYRLGAEPIPATVRGAYDAHADIVTDAGVVYEQVLWHYLDAYGGENVRTAPLAAPTVAAVETTSTQPEGVVTHGLLCCDVVEPGTGQTVRLILDSVSGGPGMAQRLSLRLETTDHAVLAQAVYPRAALRQPQALRVAHNGVVIGYDVTIQDGGPTPAAKKPRGSRKAAEPGQLPGQAQLPLEVT